MRIVVAPTAFKGSLTPGEAAAAIARGLQASHPGAEADLLPVSDGGDGFLECLLAPLRAERRSVVVRGPVHTPVPAAFGIGRGGQAIVEAALAVGMGRLSARQLDPLGATSAGLGEVLAEARQAGASELLVGLGGSACTDGGAGMARALGYRFLDAQGTELPEGGGYLHRLASIDARGFDPGWLLMRIRVACDVDNPLVGPTGSARTYAAQKGAGAAQVEQLEAGLERLAEVLIADVGVEVGSMRHGGAAGGLGAGLVAFLGAELLPGAEVVLDRVGLAAGLPGAALLVSGEGRLDGQSLFGKAAVAAGRQARAQGVRAVALAGSTGPGWEAVLGDAFDEVVTLEPAPGEDYREGAAGRLTAAAASLDLEVLP